MISNTLITIQEKMQKDNDLKNNILIQNLMESLNNFKGTEYETLKFLKNQLTQVGSYIKNDTINEALNDVDTGIGEIVSKYPEVKAMDKVNGFGLKDRVVALKESAAFENVQVKSLVRDFSNSVGFNDIPEFYNFNGVIQVLENVSEYPETKALSNDIKSYIDKNKNTLLLLETTDQLKSVPKIYDDTIKKLYEMVSSGEISSARLEMGLDEIGKKNRVINEAIQMLKKWEGSNANYFDLGFGNNAAIVENFIGPAFKDKSGVLLYADNAYYKITKNKVNENSSDVRYVLGKSGDYTLYEVPVVSVYENNRNFYDLVKSFNTLNFKFNNKKITSSQKRLPIDIALNENESLDLLIAGRKIENIQDVKFEELFEMESANIKDAAVNLLKNNDNLFNIDFVKYVINENNSSMIINIENDYYVYDRMNESKVNVYKMDGYQLFKHLKSRFGYDTRHIFDVEINESMTKYKALESTKNEYKGYIEQLEQLHESLIGAQDKVQDGELSSDVENFVDSIENAISDFKNRYIEVGDEMDALNNEPEMVSKYFGNGDSVNIQPENINGKVVASNDNDDNYTVATDDGNLMRVPGNRLMLIQVQILPDGDVGEVQTNMIDAETPVDTDMPIDPSAMTDVPTETQTEIPVEGQEIPVEGQEIPVEGQEIPVQGQEIPVEGQEIPVQGQEIPVEGQKIPVQGQEIPVEGQEDSVTFEVPIKENDSISDDAGNDAGDDAGNDAAENDTENDTKNDAEDGVENIEECNSSNTNGEKISQSSQDEFGETEDIKECNTSNTNGENVSQSAQKEEPVGEEISQNLKSIPEVPALSEPNAGVNTPAKDVPANPPTKVDISESENTPEKIVENNEEGITKSNGLDSGGPELANDTTDTSLAQSIDLTPEQLKQWNELMSIPDKNKKVEALMRRVNSLKLDEAGATKVTNAFVDKLLAAIKELKTEVTGAPDGSDDVTFEPEKIPGVVDEGIVDTVKSAATNIRKGIYTTSAQDIEIGKNFILEHPVRNRYYNSMLIANPEMAEKFVEFYADPKNRSNNANPKWNNDTKQFEFRGLEDYS